MDIRRFQHLADIYGSDFKRWPEVEGLEARALVTQDPLFAAAYGEAIGLDETLDRWTAPAPSPALRAAVIASAATSRKTEWRRGLRLWISGAGLATAAVVGVVCGAAASTAAMADARDEALVASATSDGLGSFGAVDEGRQAVVRLGGRTQSR
jgi:hypothetical protein